MEHEASLVYLHMATWAEVHRLPGAAHFLYAQSQEEREHMLRLMRYLTDLERLPLMPSCPGTTVRYGNLQELFEQALAHEQQVTASIHALMTRALEERHYFTVQLLQWFVDEQREEEHTCRKILDLFHLMGTEGLPLYTIDCHIRALRSGIGRIKRKDQKEG